MKAYQKSPLYQQSGDSKLAMHFVDVNNIADQLLYQVLAIDNSLIEKIEKSKSSRLWNAVFKPKFNINQEIYDATQVIIPAESKEALGLLIDLPMMRVKHDSIELYSTPLMTEISNTHTTGALFLINAGADVNKFAVAFGNNPLLLAISKGWNHRDTDGKENTKDSFDELHYAFTQKDIIQRLLKHPDLDVSAQHLGNGMSALHIACLRGDSLDLIQALVAKGANLELRDYIGKKPMDYLSTPAVEVKTTINRLLGLSVYDDQTAAKLTLDVSTLPNTQERAKNINSIQRYFSEANSINNTAKTRP